MQEVDRLVVAFVGEVFAHAAAVVAGTVASLAVDEEMLMTPLKSVIDSSSPSCVGAGNVSWIPSLTAPGDSPAGTT